MAKKLALHSTMCQKSLCLYRFRVSISQYFTSQHNIFQVLRKSIPYFALGSTVSEPKINNLLKQADRVKFPRYNHPNQLHVGGHNDASEFLLLVLNQFPFFGYSMWEIQDKKQYYARVETNYLHTRTSTEYPSYIVVKKRFSSLQLALEKMKNGEVNEVSQKHQIGFTYDGFIHTKIILKKK